MFMYRVHLICKVLKILDLNISLPRWSMNIIVIFYKDDY